MNILHLKYAVCIAENGSINKAAEELHVAQPNLSRVIKEMEADLGIQFFRRSSKGMKLTPDGELFVRQAQKILEQVDEMESLYKERKAGKQRFSVSAPRASYISEAFAAFSRSLGKEEAEIFYHETNALQAVKNILEVGYNLGIIRYAAGYDRYFRQMLGEKGLKSELIAEFRYVLAMREDCPWRRLKAFTFQTSSSIFRSRMPTHTFPLCRCLPYGMKSCRRRRGASLCLSGEARWTC